MRGRRGAHGESGFRRNVEKERESADARDSTDAAASILGIGPCSYERGKGEAARKKGRETREREGNGMRLNKNILAQCS